MLRLDALLHLFRIRVRTHPVQETLAALGIAVGVALAFAVLVANGSVASSAGETVRTVVGRANVQLVSRDSRGFDQRVIERVRQLAGVRAAAPLLEQRAVLHGPSGEVPIVLASLDPALVEISGGLPAVVGGGFELLDGMLVPERIATHLGLSNGATVSVDLRGRRIPLRVAAVLGKDTLGPLAEASVAVMPLQQLQAISGLRGRVTRVLVEAAPGRLPEVRQELGRIAAGRLTVAAAGADLDLLEGALAPSNQVTGFFAGMSVLLGFLLAFNAMLLTMPERRRSIAVLRVVCKTHRREMIQLLLFEALVLGAFASAIGLTAGLLLAVTVLETSSDYLAPAFTLGSTTVIDPGSALVAFAAGVTACVLASAPPVMDLFGPRPIDTLMRAGGAPGNGLAPAFAYWMLASAAAVLVAAVALLTFTPHLAIVAAALLATATVLAIPAALRLAIGIAQLPTGRHARANMLAMALLTLRATSLRSLALAATGAVAVYGCVAIGGARADLVQGIENYTRDYVGTADVWIVNRHDNQATNDMIGPSPAAIRSVPGVADVRAYQGGFLDVAGERLWIIARPRADRAMLPASQILDGDLDRATRHLRAGGWLAMSDRAADARNLRLGGPVVLPTPTGPRRFRLAATTTNLGWPPGAVIVNANDYRKSWGSTTPTAFEVDLEHGASIAATRERLAEVVGPGVAVQTAGERAAGIMVSAKQGLGRLSQISYMLLAAAIVSLASAMGAAIWQRRAQLASLRVQGFKAGQLWAVLLWETALVLSAGCLTGAAIGIYGQRGADRFLQLATGFPVAPSLGGTEALQVLAAVVGVALAIVAVPGWLASRAPEYGLSLRE